ARYPYSHDQGGLLMAVWTAAYVNNLPDSSFAYISPGGSKDSDGKTTPRSLRHLPFKDSSGKVDADHLRNALARLPQTQISSSAKASALAKLKSASKGAGVNVSEAVWTGASVDDLPDSAFAYIAPGGSKDSEGKTVPRSLRHLPFKNADGS